MVAAHGYARVSHANSFEKGDSIAAQEKRIRQYWEAHLQEAGVEWGGIHSESTAVSASKVPFHRREAGKQLLAAVQPGDHLVFDKLDRVWRSNEDFVHQMSIFKSKELDVHFADLGGSPVRTNTPIGNFMVLIMVAIAELESKMISERIKATFAYYRSIGKPFKPCAPMGSKFVINDANGSKFLVWDERERAIMAQVVYLRDEKGWSFERIADHIEVLLALEEGETFVPSEFSKRRWGKKNRARAAYTREKAYRLIPVTDPNKIPTMNEIREMMATGELDLGSVNYY